MLERTVDGIRGFTADCLTGAKEKGIIHASRRMEGWRGQVLARDEGSISNGEIRVKAGEVKSSPAMKEAYQMGKSV